MLCEYCHGKGTVLAEGGPQPCLECGGSGLVHCCEGLQAQPEGGAEGCGQDPASESEEGNQRKR